MARCNPSRTFVLCPGPWQKFNLKPDAAPLEQFPDKVKADAYASRFSLV